MLDNAFAPNRTRAARSPKAIGPDLTTFCRRFSGLFFPL
jgi:hypothetical protein